MWCTSVHTCKIIDIINNVYLKIQPIKDPEINKDVSPPKIYSYAKHELVTCFFYSLYKCSYLQNNRDHKYCPFQNATNYKS